MIESLVLRRRLLIIFIVSCSVAMSCSRKEVVPEESIVQKFYAVHRDSMYWLSSDERAARASEWLTEIRLAEREGFAITSDSINRLLTALSDRLELDPALKAKTDQNITALILDFIKFLQQGNIVFDFDEIAVHRDSVYLTQFINLPIDKPVSTIISDLDCKDPDFLVLRNYLNDSISIADTLRYKTIVLGMNYRKYLTVNRQPEYILVNIPLAEVEYYKQNELVLKMRSVMGRKLKPTPTIASYITSIVTFPFWNVPREIGVKEILPKVQKDEAYLEQHNFDVVDAKGNVLNDSQLHWKSYNAKNFPYYFRQSTGINNSLGVLKFNMNNPFSIFLHATSYQGSFANDFRFLSHGCVRLEKPFALADALMRGNLNLEELKKGKANTRPTTLTLPDSLPVFIIYMPIRIVGSQVALLDDVYGLVK